MKLRNQLIALVSFTLLAFSTVYFYLTLHSVIDKWILYKELSTTVQVDNYDGVSGSGVFVSKRGHILSCAHIFTQQRTRKKNNRRSGTDIITVTTYNGVMMGAKLVRLDKNSDLALLYLDRSKPWKCYCAILIDKDLTLGEFVRVIGYPLDLGITVTEGIVSGEKRFDNTTQTNAVINPGNSGGPVFDKHGNLVGLSEFIYPVPLFVGQSFFIPASRIKKFLEEMEAGQR